MPSSWISPPSNYDERPPGIVGHLEVGFAFQRRMLRSKSPNFTGRWITRISGEVGDRAVLETGTAYAAPGDDEFAVAPH